VSGGGAATIAVLCMMVGAWIALAVVNTDGNTYEDGCKAACSTNEVMMINGGRRCVSAERAKDLARP
jgi:hypothetical protein